MNKKFGKIVSLSLGATLFASTLVACGETTVDDLNTEDSKLILVEMLEAGYGVDWMQKIADDFEEAYAEEGYEVRIAPNPALTYAQIESRLKAGAKITDKATEYVKINNSNIVNYLVVDLCENSSIEEGLKFSNQALETIKILKKFNSEKIYKNEKIGPTVRYFTVLMNEIFYTLKKEYNGENTIRNLKKMGRYYPVLSEEFIGWLANYTNIKERVEENYKNKIIYDLKNEKDYCRAIIDYMSGMTDNYIVKIYNEIVSF